MKPLFPAARTCRHLAFLVTLLSAIISTEAQVCTSNLNTVYGMSTTGTISPINVNTAVNGSPIATSGTATTSSNGVGYSNLNGKFYFFLITGTGAAPSPQFQSYDPGTATFTTLATAPAGILNSQKIRTGCVDNAGTHYFTINPKHTGINTPALYSYNIGTNSWTTVTTSFLNPLGVSQNTTFNSLNSGDMTFDGSGNLWIIVSSTSNYALYKIAAPVPTSVTASVTVQQIIATTPVPVAGFALTGAAFNSAGTLFLSTGSGDNKLYKMTSVAAGLVLVGTMPTDDVAGDLTTCLAPLFVLPTAHFLDFTATSHNNIVDLVWTAQEDESSSLYKIQFSEDAVYWTTTSILEKRLNSAETTHSYSYSSKAGTSGYYRIVQVAFNGGEIVSVVKRISKSNLPTISLGPNPARDVLYLYNLQDGSVKYNAHIFDRAGKLLSTQVVQSSQPAVNIATLPKGSYILKLSFAGSQQIPGQPFVKQ